MIVYHGRKHIRAAKVSALAGLGLSLASLALTNPDGTPTVPAGSVVVFLAYAAFVHAIHRLDRMTWRFSRGGFIEWIFRVVGPLIIGAILTYGCLFALYMLRLLTGSVTF